MLHAFRFVNEADEAQYARYHWEPEAGLAGQTLEELLREGNVAASTVFSGAVVALTIPLAALLATSDAILDIIVWGIVAILLQLVTVVIASHLMRGMRGMIEEGKVAAALPIVAAQLAIALLNAAAMVPV